MGNPSYGCEGPFLANHPEQKNLTQGKTCLAEEGPSNPSDTLNITVTC